MPRYFLKISYDGTEYAGWQIQPNAITVQEEMNTALCKLNSNRKVETMGCGRTDAGVHASCFYLHFDFEEILDKKHFIFKLNCMLPSSIKAFEVFELKNDAHSRFDATSRTYHYFIHQEKNPFKNRFSCEFKTDLDLLKMNQACEILYKHIDFSSFSKSNTQNKTNNCKITLAKWEQIGEEELRFTITADRFLRNMVRAIVGSMIEIGTGKVSVEEFGQIILAKDRGGAGTSMPAQGLFLVDVTYDYIENKSGEIK